jgi:hypothetical protein
VVRPHGHDARPHAAKVEFMLALEGQIGGAELRAIEQLRVKRRSRCEHAGKLQPELVDVLDLVGRADQTHRGRKRLRAEIVLGVHVGGDEIDGA